MTRIYLAFDIETAKILPENFGDLHDHRPLGISCAATWCSNKPTAETFYSKNADGSPAPQMTAQDLTAFVEHLKEKSNSGYTIITHNGLGFDFDILAEESGQTDDCRGLARNHVDMMFHFFCGKGFAIGLNAAAKAIGISKPANVDGSVAPQLWKDGDYQTVLDYVAQDCRLTLDIAEASEKDKRIGWITKRGTKSYFELPTGWLTVEEACKLPLPDTSWMDTPWPRSKFTSWVGL
ncbi:MAG: hypothetical protein D8M57_12125 [Candidatus Scalindua sp. AMX11]|nr:MAG: hypothetical protein DWQ00_09135 [Candidatus Scalindua sp.]NOG84441.1 hypothetical protein [Planctomycetota bacterium]RZV72444.1 MAG: hypothetical protein EX341_14075 [Candidatus Scalindua sp. SCAELEC01]TDE64599.1 MAG: hypothetical protein D8M57_12125 [Candidatus Scalindua sp. AMX11]GJQ59695.1 MAG: hypothetical protein SCALA701_24960 [Candidatus Scalindua sp.]